MCSNNFNTSVTVEPTDDMYLGGLTHLLEVSFKFFLKSKVLSLNLFSVKSKLEARIVGVPLQQQLHFT